jgi:hypothetical protein
MMSGIVAVCFLLLFVLALSGWIARPLPTTEPGRWSLAAKLGLTIGAGLLMSVAGCFVALGGINRSGNGYAILLEIGLAVFGLGILWWFGAGLWFLSRKLFNNGTVQ